MFDIIWNPSKPNHIYLIYIYVLRLFALNAWNYLTVGKKWLIVNAWYAIKANGTKPYLFNIYIWR